MLPITAIGNRGQGAGEGEGRPGAAGVFPTAIAAVPTTKHPGTVTVVKRASGHLDFT